MPGFIQDTSGPGLFSSLLRAGAGMYLGGAFGKALGMGKDGLSAVSDVGGQLAKGQDQMKQQLTQPQQQGSFFAPTQFQSFNQPQTQPPQMQLPQQPFIQGSELYKDPRFQPKFNTFQGGGF